MKQSIQYGSKKIEFTLQYSDRKTLGITVTPELDIVVTSPVGIPVEKINEKVVKRAPWILRQEGFFLSFFPRTTERKYVGGETHLYMGRQYRLKVLHGKENTVHYRGRYIEVTTKDKAKVKGLVINWYREHAKKKFAEIAEPLIDRFRKYNVQPSNLYILDMPKRWGSCTAKGKIILNPELIKAPRGCIEYVIIHELCHLVYRDHTQKFIELQTKEMPDWERWKMKLENLLA